MTSHLSARLVRAVVLAGTALTVPLAAMPASADHAVEVMVDSDAPVFWTGTVVGSERTYEEVPACRESGCDRIKLKVDLPTALQDTPGGVQVAIRWSDFNSSIGLYAVRDGEVVAASTGQIGIGQSLLLPKTNGTYHIYVSLQPFAGAPVPDEGVAYEGLVENEDDPPVEPVREMLPDLHVLPQRLATFDTPPPFFDDVAEAGSSCFATEVVEQGASKCLRFGQAAQNKGSGPLDVRYSTASAEPELVVPAVQRIYRSDGTFRERVAGSMHYHPSHGHYHFEGFSQSWLYAVDHEGTMAGTAAATGRKNGFCMADTEMALWGLKGDAPQTYPAPRCLEPEGETDGRLLYKNGISVGWADEYAWLLPDQMIEVSGLADGRYRLVTRVDADDQLLESDETNNCVAVDVELSTGEDGRPAAAIVGDPLSCD